MTTEYEPETRRLLNKLRAQVAAEDQMKIDLPRAKEYDGNPICDVLEDTRLSLRGRCLLAYCLSRQDGFTISASTLDSIVPERMGGLFGALRELEDKGFAKRSDPDCWTFFAVPVEDSKGSDAK